MKRQKNNVSASILKLIFKTAPIAVLLYLLITVFSSCLDAAAAKFLALAIDDVSLLQSGDMRFFYYVIAYGASLYLLPEITFALTQIISSGIEHKIQLRVSEETIRKVIRLPVPYLENHENQDLIKQATSVNGGFMLNYFYQHVYMAYFLLKFLFVAAVFFQYNLYLALLSLVNLVITVAVNRHLVNRRAAFQLDMTEAERREEYYRGLLFQKDMIKDMKILGVLPFFSRLYREKAEENFKKTERFNFRITRIEVAVSLIKDLISFSILGFGFYLIVKGHLTAGGFIAFYTANGNLIQYFDLFVAKIGNKKLQYVLADKYLTLMHAEEEPREGAEGDLGLPITFRDVCFRYKEETGDILSHISFTLRPGEKLAIVGENGAGKSTLVRLLAGINAPGSGAILVGNRSLSELEPGSYRRKISIVPQDFCRYYLTVRENIGFGNVEKMDDTQAITEAAEKGSAQELIGRLDAGLEQLLGTQYRNGTELSGGEWQRLALSRAYFRDGELLILDEPTASLDAYSEEFIYRQFLALSENRTAVFVTHRMATARLADRILVIDRGRIAEEGSHGELMQKQGLYAELFKAQAEFYRDASQETEGAAAADTEE